jgi:class 3 adenylate cyclase
MEPAMVAFVNSPEMRAPRSVATAGVCIRPNMGPPRLVVDRSDDEIPPALGSPIFEPAAGERARVLTTIMLTDIVDSTRRAAELGDRDWTRLLDRHDEMAREMVDRHSGVLAKTTGDGVVAIFDVPSCAVRCALALQKASRLIGLSLRVGVHTGEVELARGDLRGIAVHAAARVMRQCAPGEVLVSRVVTDLVAGAGLEFAERGGHELKGLPGRWDLFAAGL